MKGFTIPNELSALLYAAIFCSDEQAAEIHGRRIGSWIVAGERVVAAAGPPSRVLGQLEALRSGAFEIGDLPMVACGEVRPQIARAFLSGLHQTLSESTPEAGDTSD